ncbi:MAG: hypothetical protein JST39_24540 [Bacteroidetes bacterium]|nr:hypothetical protein [Bacteroidota bacterium]
MLRHLSVIFLLVAFMGQTFNKSFLFMSYYANPAAFAEKCINKARPMMHCNGKCQMMKKMQEEERKEKEDLERKAENKAEYFSSKSLAELPEPAYAGDAYSKFPPFIANKPVDKSYDLFHPPSQA